MTACEPDAGEEEVVGPKCHPACVATREEDRLLLAAAEHRRRHPNGPVCRGAEIEILRSLELVDVAEPHEPMLDRTDTYLHDPEIARVASDPLRPTAVGDMHPERARRPSEQRSADLNVAPLAAVSEPIDLRAVFEDRIGPTERAGAHRQPPAIL